MNVTAAGLDVRRSNVSRDMQQRRTAVPRFNDCAGSVACAGSGARECNTQFPGNPRVGIGHIDNSAFMSRRDNMKSTMPFESIVKRNVVDADNSENGIDADSLELL